MLRRISIIPFAAVLLFCVPAAAQDGGDSASGGSGSSAASAIKIGPKLALQLTDYTVGDSDVDTPAGVGFQFGGQFVYSLAAAYGLQAEMYYSNRNYSRGGGGSQGDEQFDVTENHLTIPVMFRYNLNGVGGPTLTPKLLGGLYFSAFLSGKRDLAILGSGDIEPDDVNALTAGLTLGGGVDVSQVGPGVLSVDLRYQHGFVDRSPPPEQDNVEGTTNFNQSYAMLSVGYLFGLGGGSSADKAAGSKGNKGGNGGGK